MEIEAPPARSARECLNIVCARAKSERQSWLERILEQNIFYSETRGMC
jgi:hypothetical protein